MKKIIVVQVLVVSAVIGMFYFGCNAMGSKVKSDAVTSASKTVVNAGSGKNWIRNEYYFTYQFDKNPTIGTNILKVQIFDKNGNKDSSLKLTGQVGMPSMRAHDSGDLAFQMNKKNDYLLPVDLVMRGEWEIILVFRMEKYDYARARIIIKI